MGNTNKARANNSHLFETCWPQGKSRLNSQQHPTTNNKEEENKSFEVPKIAGKMGKKNVNKGYQSSQQRHHSNQHDESQQQPQQQVLPVREGQVTARGLKHLALQMSAAVVLTGAWWMWNAVRNLGSMSQAMDDMYE